VAEREYMKGKLDVSNDVGDALDKLLEQAEAEAQQRVGQAVAFKEGAEKVRLLHTHIDKDFADGKLKGISDLEGVSTVKLYVTRACEALLNLSERAKAEHLVANGKAASARQAVEVAQRHAVAAKSRLEQIYAADAETQKAIEAGKNIEREPRGGRPSLAERRASKKATKKKE